MEIERKVTEALFAEAEQVEITPGLWLRIQSEVVTPTKVPAGQSKGRLRIGLFQGLRVKPLAFAGFVAALILAAMLAIPSTRTVLAQWLGLSFEQTASPNQVVQKVVSHQPLSETDSYEYSLYELPRARWTLLQENGFRVPQPGEQIALPNGDRVSAPAFLPEGYAWQDVIVPNQSMRAGGFLSIGGTSGGGGGLAPMPDFDRSFAAFLIGGNPTDHYLVLAQFRDQPGTDLSVRTFFTTAPDRPVVRGEPDGNSAEDILPTPTPVPQSFAAKFQIGVVIEPPQAENGITLMVGPEKLHEVTVNGERAWWYSGAWSLQGEWQNEETLTNLVWKRGKHVYQLVGEGLDVEILIRIAESIQ
jgi:hypothetical protein